MLLIFNVLKTLHSHTHCQVALKRQPHNRNLSISVSVPTHDRQESSSKLEGKMTENKEHQAVTAYIIKCGFSTDNQHFHPLQPRCFSTGKCHAIRP